MHRASEGRGVALEFPGADVARVLQRLVALESHELAGQRRAEQAGHGLVGRFVQGQDDGEGRAVAGALAWILFRLVANWSA